MKTREKIIILLAIAAIIYGIYILFFAASPRLTANHTDKNAEETKTMVLDLVKGLTKDDTSKRDIYIITSAAAKWVREPFLTSEHRLVSGKGEANESAAPTTIDLLYTGFLQAGDKRLAVINGMEYEMGEHIDAGNYTVKNITPKQTVVIRNQDGVTLALPLQETATAQLGEVQILQPSNTPVDTRVNINPMDN